MKSDVLSPSRGPVMLSAFVYPGSGQIMQGRRRLAGILFILSFTACFVLLLYSVIGPMSHNLRVALGEFEGGASEPFVEMSVPRILGLLGLAVLIHLINICDALRHYRLAMSAWRRRQIDTDE